jgi:hypothetical protein
VRVAGAALGGVVGVSWGESACLALTGFALQAALIFGSQLHSLQRLPAQAG